MPNKTWLIILSSSCFKPVKILISERNCNLFNMQIMSLMVILLPQKMLKSLSRKLPIKTHQPGNIKIFIKIHLPINMKKVNRSAELATTTFKTGSSQ